MNTESIIMTANITGKYLVNKSAKVVISKLISGAGQRVDAIRLEIIAVSRLININDVKLGLGSLISSIISKFLKYGKYPSSIEANIVMARIFNRATNSEFKRT